MCLLIFRYVLVTNCALQVSDDGRYVLLSIREGCDPVNRLWYCDLQTTPQGIIGMFCMFICKASKILFIFLIFILGLKL